MSSVLVTGGAGFIGSHVAESLVARGHRVTVLDDLSGGFEMDVPRDACFVHGSVTGPALVGRCFAGRRFDWMHHLGLASVFSGRSQVSLDPALEQTASWVCRHGARQRGAFDIIEIARGLPASWVT